MIMPDATMVKIVMKFRGALESNTAHRPAHRSRMQTKRMRFPVVIVACMVHFCLNGKVRHYL